MVDLQNISNLSSWGVFCVSMLMGVSHVILGPDHVSALLLLVAGVKRREQINDENTGKRWHQSALQGFRWGVGHTLGLGSMTAIFMAFKNSIPVEKIATASDYIVGSMMLTVGITSLVSLHKWRVKEQKKKLHLDNGNDQTFPHPSDGLPISVLPISEAHNEAHEHNMCHTHEDSSGITYKETLWIKFKKWRIGDTFTDSPRSAYIVGAVHGVSGLSGIVYILPVLFLNDTMRLSLYMFGFTITSIMSMYIFAAFLGFIPHSTKKIMILNGVAGTLVSCIGVMWIVLTSMNKLDL